MVLPIKFLVSIYENLISRLGPHSFVPPFFSLVRADWHDCFDSSQFILLPRSEVISRIQSFNDKYPDDPAKAGKAIPWSKPVRTPSLLCTSVADSYFSSFIAENSPLCLCPDRRLLPDYSSIPPSFQGE